MPEEEWADVGYIISSTHRVIVLEQLSEGPRTPTQLADASSLDITHVSRSLQALRDEDLETHGYDALEAIQSLQKAMVEKRGLEGDAKRNVLMGNLDSLPEVTRVE